MQETFSQQELQAKFDEIKALLAPGIQGNEATAFIFTALCAVEAFILPVGNQCGLKRTLASLADAGQHPSPWLVALMEQCRDVRKERVAPAA